MGVAARTWSVGLLLAGALGAAAWLWFRPPEGAVGIEEAGGEGASAGEDATTLAARGAAREPQAETRHGGRGTVVGDVRKAGAPAPARVVAFDVSRDASGGRGSPRAEEAVPPPEGAAPPPVAEASAGPDGSFRLELGAPGSYLLLATGDGFARGVVRVAADGVRVAARLDLRGGPETLAGRAVHADGRPFRGSVVVEPLGREGPTSFVQGAVTTDDDGRFLATGLEAGLHTVAAFVPGRWRAQGRSVALPHAGEYVLVVDEGTRDVAGRVVEEKDGRGVAGALVTTSAWSVATIEALNGRAVTESDGRFTIRAAVSGTQWRVDATGFATLTAFRRTTIEGAVLEFRLQRLARLSGRVTAEGDGAPVPGVTVYAYPALRGGESVTRGTTDADGRYAIPGVPPGDQTVFAWGNGWCSPEVDAAQTQGFNPLATTIASDTAAVVDLVVRRAARASGRVTDPAEAPVAGAQVTAQRALQGNNPSPFLAFLAADRPVATDAEGRFVVDTLLPGVSWRFGATAPAASPAESPPLRADAATPLVVDLRLGAPRWAEVEVVEKSAGTPIAGVQVQANQQVVGGNWKSFGPATTGAGGRARIGPMPPGPFLLWAWGEGYELADQPTVGGPEGSTADVQAKLVLARTSSVEGVVRYADGEPVATGVIRVKAVDFESTEELSDGGRFRIECPTTVSSVEVAALKDWGGEVLGETRAVPGGPSITLTLPGARPPRMLLRVTDPSGRPVPYAACAIQAGEFTEWPGVMDGRAEFSVPAAGEAHVFLYGARSDAGPLPLALAAVGPIDTKKGSFDLRLEPEMRIEGVVRTGDGRPVRGVFLRVRPKSLPAPFDSWSLEIGTARTDDAGRFRLGGLAAGLYEIRVDAADRGGRTEPVEAKAGTTDLVITLAEGGEAALTVLAPDGRPVGGAMVRVRTQGMRASTTETDGAGVARLKGLDARARYRLDVTPPETRLDLLPLQRESWYPRDDVLTLAPALALEGVVRDVAGAVVSEGWVDAIRDGSVAQRAKVTREGRFTFQRLGAGAYRLVARTQDPPRTSPPSTVQAGAREVVLVLDPATSLAVRLTGWTQPPDSQWASLWEEETGVRTDWAEIAEDGTFRIGNLHPRARYTLYVVREWPGDESGPGPAQVAWKSGIPGDAGEVTVALEPGASIGVRVILPPGVESVNVWATDGLVRQNAWMPEPSRGKVLGLHAGSWTVKADASSPLGTFSAEARADAGGSVELDLKPVR